MPSAKVLTTRSSRLLEEETLPLETSQETRTYNNSTWMLRPRPSNQYPTRGSHGTSKTPENLETCKSGKPMPDGSNSSD
jgi:hypothetical protein